MKFRSIYCSGKMETEWIPLQSATFQAACGFIGLCFSVYMISPL